MSSSTDGILERELAKLGRNSGALGGLAGAGLAGAAGGGLGGGTGAAWAARRLPSRGAEVTVEVPMNPRAALTAAFRALSTVGEIVADEVTPDEPVLRAVVGAGTLGLNPAVIELSVEAISEAEAKITVRATAKEGLIKQHTAEKALQRVLAAAGWRAS